MSEVKAYTFNIGQGLFNLLTEIATDGTKFCAIFDCGTIQDNSKQTTEQSLDFAVQIIQKFGGLNLIVISHQDKDHWNKILNLLLKYYKINIGNDWVFSKNKNMYLKKCLCEYSTYKVLKEYAYNCFTIYEWSKYNQCDFEKVYHINVNDIEKKVELEVEVKTNYCNNEIKYEIVILEKVVDDIYIEVNEKQKHYNKNTCDKIFQDFAETLAYFLKPSIDRDISILKTYQNFERPDCECKIEELIPKIIICGDERSSCYNNFCKVMEFFGEKVSSFEYTAIAYLKYDNIYNNYNFFSHFYYSHLDISIRRNVSSTISVYKYDNDKSIIFPGDATYHVFDYLCEIIKVSEPVELLIAPHHGSFDTNIVTDDKKNPLPDNEQPFLKLLDIVKPKTVFISALLSKFGHPDLKFLEYVSKFAQTSYQHPIVYGNKSNLDKNIEDNIIKDVQNKAVFSTESNSNNYLLFPDILQGQVKEVSKPQQNNFILPADDLFI